MSKDDIIDVEMIKSAVAINALDTGMKVLLKMRDEFNCISAENESLKQQLRVVTNDYHKVSDDSHRFKNQLSVVESENAELKRQRHVLLAEKRNLEDFIGELKRKLEEAESALSDSRNTLRSIDMPTVQTVLEMLAWLRVSFEKVLSAKQRIDAYFNRLADASKTKEGE